MKLKLLILLLALQSAWILGTTVVHERTLARGKAVLLETSLVDPRDVLRGDYVWLNYTISDVPTNLFSPVVTRDLPDGTTIHVALALSTNEFHQVARASTNAIAPAANEVVLRGQSDRGGWRWSTNTIHVRYGIERYYVPEGTGNPHGKLTVQAVIPDSGQALIKEVFIDGKPYRERMKGTGQR
jgi:uncharacterized membrane-anchored protein